MLYERWNFVAAFSKWFLSSAADGGFLRFFIMAVSRIPPRGNRKITGAVVLFTSP
jgi:hypothetical protein